MAGIDEMENELLVLETIHRYVETLDRYFENVIFLYFKIFVKKKLIGL